jgi:putative sigma-54 modulation protein
MNLNVSGHHVTITPAIRGHVQSKIARISRHFDHLIDVNVILSSQKLRRKAEATVHVRGKDIFVVDEDENLFAAIDLMAARLDRSIVKYKDRLRAHPHETMKHRASEADIGE